MPNEIRRWRARVDGRPSARRLLVDARESQVQPTTYHAISRTRLYGYAFASARTADHERLRGHCTGIPECCIEYFVGPWLGVMSMRCRNWEAELEFRAVHATMIGYVACPLCRVERSFVKPRRCRRGDCVCGGWRR